MKLNKIAIAFGLVIAATSGAALASTEGSGTVTFKGAIIDAPCSITPDTADQTVNLGQVSSKVLLGGGTSAPQQFNIKLENCDTTGLTEKTVTTAFTGIADGDNLKLEGGTASGASIAIQDSKGADIKINGTAGAAEGITDGTNTLHFAAYLKGNAGSDAIQTGNFSSVANFVLAYQ